MIQTPSTPAATESINSTARLIDPVGLTLVLLSIAGWAVALKVLPYIFGTLGAIILLGSASAASGRLTVSAEGFRGRQLHRAVSNRWDEITSLTVARGLLFWHVSAFSGRRNTTIRLPALRTPWWARSESFDVGVRAIERIAKGPDGQGPTINQESRSARLRWAFAAVLILGTIGLEKPWFWVTPDHFNGGQYDPAQGPNPCDVLDQGVARQRGLTGPKQPSPVSGDGGGRGSECVWGDGTNVLRFANFVIPREGITSGSGRASKLLLEAGLRVGTRQPDGRDVADESLLACADGGNQEFDGGLTIVGSGIGRCLVAVRVSNLLLYVFDTNPDTEAAKELALLVARDAATRLADN
jgi:hypothetical protein